MCFPEQNGLMSYIGGSSIAVEFQALKEVGFYLFYLSKAFENAALNITPG